MIAEQYTDLIGNTAMLELRRLAAGLPGRVLAKLEMSNPYSHKDRMVLSMVRSLQSQGKLAPGGEVVEASSGNTAIALAALATTMGFKARIYMSEAVSNERKAVLKAFGATVVLTPAVEHTRGARQRAIQYVRENPRSCFLSQHDNPANGEIHYSTTAPEIWADCNGQVDAIVTGLGSAGTFSGVARYFKERNPSVRMICFEPASSPVFSGGKQGLHHIHGIGPGMISPNFEPVRHLCDEIVLVTDADAFAWTRRVARSEGLLVGITSGAAAKVACDLAARPEMAGKTIVCFFYDTGERYLSTPGLFCAVERQHDA